MYFKNVLLFKKPKPNYTPQFGRGNTTLSQYLE